MLGRKNIIYSHLRFENKHTGRLMKKYYGTGKMGLNYKLFYDTITVL
jgi:hypothetical protein